MWHVSAPHRPCIGHRTGYSLHENARISGLASADFEGGFAHSYKRWRPRLFLRALRLGLSMPARPRNQVDRTLYFPRATARLLGTHGALSPRPETFRAILLPRSRTARMLPLWRTTCVSVHSHHWRSL